MGIGSAAIWYVDVPDAAAVLRSGEPSDPDAASALARRLFPGFEPVPHGLAPITSFTASTDPARILVGCFPGVTVVCASEPAVLTPSTIDEKWVRPLASEHTYLIAAENAHAWGAFAEWERGILRRSFSASLAYIHENEGLPNTWERPYWAGEHPIAFPDGALPDPQALPFHPQQFADAAGAQWLGTTIIGGPMGDLTDPTRVVVSDFVLRDPSAVPTPREHKNTGSSGSTHKRSFFGKFRRAAS